MRTLRCGRRILCPVALATWAGALVPPAARACEVCYGAADSPWIDASRAAVALLVGVTVCVQVAFAWFFLSMRRRAKVEASRRAAITLFDEKGTA